MAYGKGYYDNCCCCCSIGCGPCTCSVFFALGIISAMSLGNFYGGGLDFILVIWLTISFCKRDDKYGMSGVNTAKGAFIFSLILAILSFIGQVALFSIIISERVEEETFIMFTNLGAMMCWRVW